MPPKKDQLREVVSQLIYACVAEKEQYEETIDAVIQSLEMYISNLTLAALKCADTPNKIKPDDVIRAMVNDPQKQTRVQRIFEEKKKTDEEAKSFNSAIPS
ncbi:hypothetical protein M9Y10_023085 [Tritrichomonas musculus]|uniref:Transcription initiation factor TFIID subunit 12 domain-containing protein n=1 Tax=Tritrichomonas musculus TaxID=1915356 RepID=A0ABR2KUY5_9EUKA